MGGCLRGALTMGVAAWGSQSLIWGGVGEPNLGGGGPEKGLNGQG